MTNKLFAVVLFIFVAGCGGNDQNQPQNSAKSEKPANSSKAKKSSTKSVIKVSGAENFTFEKEAKFGCRDNLINIMTMTQSPKFQIYLPANAGEGTFELADFDANRKSNYVDGKAVVSVSGNFVKGSGNFYGKLYFTNSKGTVTVKNSPSKAGEIFEAEVNASLQSKDGETINVDADLSLPADGFMMLNCQL